MRTRRVLFVLIAGLLLILGACGGGGGGGSSSSSSSGGTTASLGTVSVFVTDDLTTEYSKAWITILKVTAVSSDGTEYPLFEDPAGRVFNLLELSGVGALLNVAELPEGTYNTVRITMKNEITLTDKQGSTMNAAFAPTGQEYVMDVSGSFTVVAGQNTSFGLDFDTKQFSYDAGTGLVSSMVIFKTEEEMKGLHQTDAEVEGHVVEVLDSQSFTMQLEHGMTVVTVTLHPTAVVYDEDTGSTSSDTSLLQAMQKVDVYGNYDPDALTVEALSVKIEDSGGSGTTAKAEGVVQSVDGTTVTLDVREAKNFVPQTDTITVDLSGASFSKGSPDMLSEGQWLEVKGTWDGTTFTATVAEIEGAPSGDGNGNENGNMNGNTNENMNGNMNENANENMNGNMNDNMNGHEDYVEVKGTVESVDGTTMTVSITRYEHFVPPADTVDVDMSTAWFKHRRC